ncbi:DUF3188 domain-containing protein [Prochlorococcus sp. MIT 1300]|uniref:DUF3188 domain-containing protein n=1 Tax=Prochlorococcus sp. MIT 1300 TaxID=3096218 RepID=UPI002A76038C|nr:DUF3188 domain-containing protein [Prochlorococcus sp. MIT 1300]
MKSPGHLWLSLAAPFLIVLACFGLIVRQGTDQLQSLPALLVGAGLIISGSLGRRRRRQKLLLALLRDRQVPR